MIRPLNGHVVIEPVLHDGFVSQIKTTYEEIGVVVILPSDYQGTIKPGDKVYFDSWMVAKFPKENDTFHWLVPYENIKAYEPQDEIPTQ